MRLISDFALAAVTIWQEARGEPWAGKVAVGNVIRNRMKTQGKTVAEVVLAPYQFSGWNTRDPNRIPSVQIMDTDPTVAECAQAWLASENLMLVGMATNYCNLEACTARPEWATDAAQVARIGRHTFYTDTA